MRNNSVLGSCDQAVRQAGGLVLELCVALIVKEREQGYRLLIQLAYTVPTDRIHKTVEDGMLNDKSAPRSLSGSHT